LLTILAGTQFFNLNQQFIMNYRKCQNMKDTEDAEVQYKCLGDWYVGKNHFFAVVNSRESRIEEKYRCFVSSCPTRGLHIVISLNSNVSLQIGTMINFYQFLSLPSATL